MAGFIHIQVPRLFEVIFVDLQTSLYFMASFESSV